MKKNIFPLLVSVVFVLTASIAQAASLKWTGKTCVTIDGSFNVCKPDTKWDTQTSQLKTKDAVVKWERHLAGANPAIKLIYNQNVSGQTAHDYAKVVIADLKRQGMQVSHVKNTVINGRNVTLMNATKPDAKMTDLIAVYRDQHKGLWLWCAAEKSEYKKWEPQFRSVINSVKFVGK